jgi:hypothetical protein
MGLTAWTIVLAGVGLAGFFGRKWWLRRKEQAKIDAAKRKRRQEEAELDRIACEDLGQSLMSSTPGNGRRDAEGKSTASGHESSG